ncbi:MAG: hypothetical protein E6936_16380 [Clostridium perfringens]|nr:hypothetical protein [Clostridium perfringens]
MYKKWKALSLAAISALLIGINGQSTYAFEKQLSDVPSNKIEQKSDNSIMYIEALNENKLCMNENVTETNNSIQLYLLSKPSSIHNLRKQGKMTFNGSAKNTTLYSNKNFTGSKSAGYRIENYSNNKLIVRVRKRWSNSIVKKLTIPARAAMGGFLDLSSSSEYYLQFDGYNSGPTNFSGYLTHKN